MNVICIDIIKTATAFYCCCKKLRSLVHKFSTTPSWAFMLLTLLTTLQAEGKMFADLQHLVFLVALTVAYRAGSLVLTRWMKLVLVFWIPPPLGLQWGKSISSISSTGESSPQPGGENKWSGAGTWNTAALNIAPNLSLGIFVGGGKKKVEQIFKQSF